MRILMLTQFVYPPTIGGEERYVADLSQELVARGHDVAIVTYWQKDFPEFEVYRGVRIYRVRGSMQKMSFLFSSERTYAPSFPDPGVVSALRRIIREERPEIVHAHNWFVHSFTPLKTMSNAKLVMSLHDYSMVCVQKRLMRDGAPCSGPGASKCLACSTRFYSPVTGPLTTVSNAIWAGREGKTVDLFLPVSQAVADGSYLDQRGLPYKVVPNFIPDEVDALTDPDDAYLAQLPKEDYMLFVGDITYDKGATILLQAYAEMKSQVPLVLIGRPLLKELTEHLPPNVLLMGTWPHNAVMGAWRRALFGLVPSTWGEPCPSVAMEAMVMGKPVIAARSGGLTDIVADGESGLLVAARDAQALCGAMQLLLDDPELRGRMGAQARQRAILFQAQSVVTRFEQVYRELLAPDNSTDSRTLVATRSR